METPRPGPEKLGAVRTDRDLIGLLFTLIYRAITDRQERAQNPVITGDNSARKGLIDREAGGRRGARGGDTDVCHTLHELAFHS